MLEIIESFKKMSGKKKKKKIGSRFNLETAVHLVHLVHRPSDVLEYDVIFLCNLINSLFIS